MEIPTYSGIINSAPYVDTLVIKKECIGHVRKWMERLRECKKKIKVPVAKINWQNN